VQLSDTAQPFRGGPGDLPPVRFGCRVPSAPPRSTARVAFLILILACASPEPPPEPVAAMSADSITRVLARHTTALMAIPGVVGVGEAICDDAPCIRVYLASADARSRLPATLEGIRIDAIVSGPVGPRTID